ncbi:unnamed protein product, partial [Ectocarpus sp. 6 AP-2014]
TRFFADFVSSLHTSIAYFFDLCWRVPLRRLHLPVRPLPLFSCVHLCAPPLHGWHLCSSPFFAYVHSWPLVFFPSSLFVLMAGASGSIETGVSTTKPNTKNDGCDTCTREGIVVCSTSFS